MTTPSDDLAYDIVLRDGSTVSIKPAVDDDVTALDAVRVWRHALRDACLKANVPHRLLHDCRRTAARNLIRAGVPERIAMLLTGHKTRAVFDRYNIVNESERLHAGERLAAYLNPCAPPSVLPEGVDQLRGVLHGQKMVQEP